MNKLDAMVLWSKVDAAELTAYMTGDHPTDDFAVCIDFNDLPDCTLRKGDLRDLLALSNGTDLTITSKGAVLR